MSKTQAPDPAQPLVLVPREPTPEMLAALDSSAGDTITDPRAFAQAVWKDMLAASPAIPAPEGTQVAAMRLALDALESLPPGAHYTRKAAAAITALRAALAAPAPQATDAELERRTGEPHVDGWPLVSGLPAPKAPAWQPIETAPRGSGEDGPHDTRDPAYIEPPTLLLWTQEGPRVGYYDWYYHPGYGRGADPHESPWRCAEGGQAYGPTHWMHLPAAPQTKEPTNDR